MLRVFISCLAALVLPLTAAPETPEAIAREVIAPLMDPVKLDFLTAKRAANSRVCKIAYWLETARIKGQEPEKTIEQAQRQAGYAGTPRGKEDMQATMRNRIILERLGCLDVEGMAKLRRGNCPVIRKGPYVGTIASVDHIIPRAVAPGLDNRLYNLEFMPLPLNMKKGDKVGQRQRSLAKQWHTQRLISGRELEAVICHR